MSDQTQKRANVFFSFLKDISWKKEGDLMNSESEKVFDSYMLLRYLSMYPNYIPLCDLANTYQGTLGKEQFYRFLLELIPARKVFFNYITKKGQKLPGKLRKVVAEVFEISEANSEDYIGLMDAEEKRRFSDAFGGTEK